MSTSLEAPPESSSGRRRLQLLVVVGLIVALVVGFTWASHQRRDDEWSHGGDKVKVGARIEVTDAAGFGDALDAAGGTRNGAIVGVQQGFVVNVTWTGPREAGGYYQFVLLDDRVAPARPVRPGSGSAGGERVTLGWDGRYEVLHQRYPWLAATAARQLPDGSSTDSTEALGVPAKDRGSATLAFYDLEDANPVTDPAHDLELAMFLVDSGGEVRWARKIPLAAAG